MHDILQQILYFFGHGFCHQLSERSLEAGGLFFCVCARCTGIYLGFMVTLIVVVLACYRRFKLAQGSRTFVSVPLRWTIIAGVILIIPMAIDGAGSYAGLFETTNLNRYITGYLCGMGLGIIASGGLTSLLPHPSSSHSPPTISTPGRLIAILLISAFGGALFWLGYPYLGIAAPLISLVSLWLSATFVLLLIVSSTKLWTPNISAARRAALVALCLPAALVVMAVFSLFASLLGIVAPWYRHP